MSIFTDTNSIDINLLYSEFIYFFQCVNIYDHLDCYQYILNPFSQIFTDSSWSANSSFRLAQWPWGNIRPGNFPDSRASLSLLCDDGCALAVSMGHGELFIATWGIITICLWWVLFFFSLPELTSLLPRLLPRSKLPLHSISAGTL